MLWVSVWKLGITSLAGFAQKCGCFPVSGRRTALPRKCALAAENSPLPDDIRDWRGGTADKIRQDRRREARRGARRQREIAQRNGSCDLRDGPGGGRPAVDIVAISLHAPGPEMTSYMRASAIAVPPS
jgi:hypothetical protein